MQSISFSTSATYGYATLSVLTIISVVNAVSHNDKIYSSEIRPDNKRGPDDRVHHNNHSVDVVNCHGQFSRYMTLFTMVPLYMKTANFMEITVTKLGD